MRSPRARDYHRLSQFLLQARLDAGMTQHELARKLGKAQSFVTKYETGARKIEILSFVKICRALGLNPSREMRRVLKTLSFGSPSRWGKVEA